MREPHEYPRRILLVAAGLTPQVVTETIYALTQVRRPAWFPTEVHLLTTSEGAERARLGLLNADQRWFQCLFEEYEMPPAEFGPHHIQVIRNQEGHPLRDLQTEADNVAAADTILDCVRRLTADKNASLHVSLAGGRKTMGYYLGYALSLYGRSQDQLSHVLVDPPFESHPGFFYPSRQSRVIYTFPPDSRPLDTATARVRLAEIPFVRLRSILPPWVLEQSVPFERAVNAAQQGVGGVRLVINLEESRAEAGGTRLSLPPTQFAFLTLFARRARAGLPGVECPSEGCDPALAQEFLKEYEQAFGRPPQGDRTRKVLAEGMPRDFFLQHKARLHRALDKALSWRAAAYQIRSRGKRPATTYQLELRPDQIEFIEKDKGLHHA